MPTKFQLITELYDQTVQSVTGSYQSWTGFLRAACYNYKCPFDDQILIYAQRPDATAVLEMERWNRQFGRWVNRGAKSIAVFGDDGQNCLKLYFDVSDTHASRFARPLPIWTMHPAFEPEVIETLEATFGNLAEKENLADAVRSACHNAVADNFTDYLQDLRECREDSLLEELDDLNLEVFYRDALEVSVAYMLMTRLGLRADDYFSPDEFAHVYEFNTPTTINALGIATSDIAEMGLREISRTVIQAQRDQFFANREKNGYLHTDIDAFRLINTLIQNTTPQKSQTSDPFWDKAETAFLSALILYLFHEAPESERNFGTLMYMVINAEAREEDESYRSPVDLLFDDLERVDEDHIAVKNWKVFKQAGPKTAKSILVSASTRLAAFNTEEMAHLTSHDDLSLGTLGDRKRVIFAVIPDEDTTFNYLVGLMYSQAFRELYHTADNKYGGRLPVPVRVLMDEFANVALPEDFERVLATCRSREISINIVIQNMAQLKKLFKDSWENVTGNCDTLLYLGGNEASTHEYISKMLGKATIDTQTRGVTKGRSGSSSTNYQNAGRELLMPDEVRMLDNRKALIFIRGERPVMDDKYPVQKHPNYRFSADGGPPPYEKRFDIPCYERNDLSHEIDIKNLEILEETQYEEETHSDRGREDAQGKAPLFHRCTDLCSRLRHLYARFRRR